MKKPEIVTETYEVDGNLHQIVAEHASEIDMMIDWSKLTMTKEEYEAIISEKGNIEMRMSDMTQLYNILREYEQTQAEHLFGEHMVDGTPDMNSPCARQCVRNIAFAISLRNQISPIVDKSKGAQVPQEVLDQVNKARSEAMRKLNTGEVSMVKRTLN